MGSIAQVVSEGLGQGSVIGVIPEALKPREVGARQNDDLFAAATMTTSLHRRLGDSIDTWAPRRLSVESTRGSGNPVSRSVSGPKL